MRTKGLLFAVAVGAMAIPLATAQEGIRSMAPLAVATQRPAFSSVVPAQVTATFPYAKRTAAVVVSKPDAQRERPMTSIERSELAAVVAAVSTANAAKFLEPLTIEPKSATLPVRRSAAEPVKGDPSVIKKFTFSPVDGRYQRYADVPRQN